MYRALIKIESPQRVLLPVETGYMGNRSDRVHG